MNHIQMKRYLYVVACLAIILMFTSCTPSEQKKQEKQQQPHHHLSNDKSLNFSHIHGLGFSTDGALLLAAHDGLRQFYKSKWSRPPGDRHDYMGFQVVESGFYSSGHPAPGHQLPNPLGVVFSPDKGKTVNTINLLGKTDLHLFAVGYFSNAMYALNEYPNDIMPKKHLYVSYDLAKNWSEAKMDGLIGTINSLAVHPSNKSMVAAATNQGLYLSIDGATSFKKLTSDIVTSMFFSTQSNRLMISKYNSSKLHQVDLKNKYAITELAEFNDNLSGIIYIAQHPTNNEILSIATSDHSVFLTENMGGEWQKIAENGNISTN